MTTSVTVTSAAHRDILARGIAMQLSVRAGSGPDLFAQWDIEDPTASEVRRIVAGMRAELARFSDALDLVCTAPLGLIALPLSVEDAVAVLRFEAEDNALIGASAEAFGGDRAEALEAASRELLTEVLRQRGEN